MKLSNPKNTKNILLLIFLFLICWRHVFSRTQEDDRVIKLPGQPNSPQVSQFSGYITVNNTHGRALFYWFFQSQFDSSKKPLLLWLNGGPGCSSIGYGAAVELGPLLVQNNGAGLDFNEHSWNKEANLLFLESPVGVGFSYTNTSSDLTNLDDDFAAEDAYNFLVNWLERFPEFKNREFFISGESYAGHYVPQLAELVYNRNKDSKKYPYINLKGFIVGNPETNDYYDYKGILEYAWSHAILYDSEYQKAKQACDFKLSNWSYACNDAMQVLWDKYNEIDIYNIYGPKCLVNTPSSSASDIVSTHDASHIKAPNHGFRRMNRIPGGYDPCYTSFTAEYFNRLDVQIALHASTEGTQARNKWKSCSDPVFNTYDYNVFSVLPVYERLIKGGLKIWIFSGDADGRVPVIGTRDCVEALNLTLKSPWHSWFLNKQVYNSESDIDVLCVGPYFATIAEDFFIVLHNMLASRPEVSEIHCVKDAKVPLMLFKFDGISIDLPYARLKVISIPENVDVFNPFFLKNIDDTSWKSLSGVRANRSILHLVPNIEVFQAVLRCIKLWAKRRGVYGNLLGFFGGIHLAVLSAFICRRHPSVCLSTLILLLFKTFALWPWPTPVILQDQIARPFIPNHDKVSWMPILLPCSPYEFCHSNITRSTFYKIRTEFLRGHMLTKDMLSRDFDWNILFEPFPYARKYGLFVKIFLSACGKDELGDWVGWVKSRFRCLLVKLEELFGFCDPNPTEYVDTDVSEPNVIFYWGLPTGRADLIKADLVEEYFLKSIDNGLNQRSTGTIKLSIVKTYQLPKKADQLGALERKNSKPCWRVVNGNRKKSPPQPKYKPHCADDYLPTNENTEYPSAGG